MPNTKKCVVWDLDNTLWYGVCLEGDVSVREEVAASIKELDQRGILQSIASRGDEGVATNTLKRFGLEKYFLVPQINWLPKSRNILRISKELGLSLDSIAFVDDDRFEREQVAFMLPDVLTIDSIDAGHLPARCEFRPRTLTPESRERRRLYLEEFSRKDSERTFGSREEFLRSCAMKLHIRPMEKIDIPRVLELMTRTHQLNTTGRLMEAEDLEWIFQNEVVSTSILVAELRDIFGSYGCIGTAIVSITGSVARMTYLAVSCRVMGRGVERSIIAWIARCSRENGIRSFEAEFRDTGKNRMMRALYQMEGMTEVPDNDNSGTRVFRAKCEMIPDVPSWMEIE